MRQTATMGRLVAAGGWMCISALLVCALIHAPSAAAATSGASVKPRLTAYFQSDFTDVPYQQAAYDKVGKSWVAPADFPKPGKKVVVQSSIGRDGKLLGAVVTMKSGSAAWDDAALAAVRKAAPFGPLPAAYKGPQVEVHWHFDTQR